jgi:hypothetical protein
LAGTTPITATGTITFYDGANALGSPVTLSGGSASLTTTTLPVGTNTVLAVYSGDNQDAASISQPITVTVISSAE